MNTKEMRAKSPEDLNKELLGLRKAQFSLRMQIATQQLTKTSEVARVKREIAQVKTILTEKTRAAQ
jgi:large subunit ribosomal protein L29